MSQAPPPPGGPRFGVGSRLALWLVPGLVLGLVLPVALRLPVLVGYNALLCLLWLLDAKKLGSAHVKLARELPRALSHLSPARCEHRLENQSGTRLRVWLEDQLPDSFERSRAVHRLDLPTGHTGRAHTHFVALSRGEFAMSHTALKLERPLGLCALKRSFPCASRVWVLPRMERSAGALRVRRNQLGALATRLSHAPRGREFESLREYVPGDGLRDIDWKATARRGRPVTRAYRPERSQPVWLVLDASRSMTLPSGTGPRGKKPQHTRFDASLQAALRLAHAAVRAGDQVGALVFASEQRAFVPLGRGPRHYARLVRTLSGVSARATHLDTRGLARALLTHAQRRALVVIFGDLANESEAEQLLDVTPLLKRRHVMSVISLRDRSAEQTLERSASSPKDVFLKVAAIDLNAEHERNVARLRKLGVHVVRAHPEGIERKVRDLYLAVKLAGKL